jgi:hypothetical protein
MTAKALPILLLILSVPGWAVEHVHSDVKDNRYWFQTVIVPPEDFTLPQIERRTRDFINRAMRGRGLVVFSVYTDVQDAAMAMTATRGSYRQWKLYYDAVSSRPLRAAEAIAIGEDAVLRVRQADGTVLRQVLAGKDPLQFKIDGAAFEILIVQPRVGTRFDRCEPGPSVSPLVEAKTNVPLSASLCIRAAARVAELLKTRKLFVGFRNDHWFISSADFPVRYPFSAEEPPPSEEEYYRTVTFSCGVLCQEEPHCTQIQGPPLPRPRRGRGTK